jgi:serine/threonine protein kinase
MAEVFDGRSLGSHGFEKRVAIKRILPELAGDHTFTSRLVVEAKLAVAMQHANIVQALDLVRDGHDVFLVMEFINGPTLRRLLQERYAAGIGPLPLGLSTFVLHEAAAGLDYAHTQPGGAVIHADISPSNLLISRAGEVKLADFGIARREGIARAAEGKWGYMAPEQERGEPLSPRADLYALGVVFYELLTGVHPFSSRSARNPRSAEPLIAPHLVRPDLPRPLSELCCQMLAPQVADRPASARQVTDRLAELRYLAGWREGRSELADAIAKLVPEAAQQPASSAGASMTGSISASGSAMSGSAMSGMSGSGMSGSSLSMGMTGALTGGAFSTNSLAHLPPRQATEHTGQPLRQATEHTQRPLTLVTSSLLDLPSQQLAALQASPSSIGELLGPAGAAVGTSTSGLANGQGPGAALMSPVPGMLTPVPGAMTPQQQADALLAGPGGVHPWLAAGQGGLATSPPTLTSTVSARPLGVALRTWVVLGLAALAGVLWGVRSVVREVSSAPPAVVASGAPEAPPPSPTSGASIDPASASSTASSTPVTPPLQGGAGSAAPPAGGAVPAAGSPAAGGDPAAGTAPGAETDPVAQGASMQAAGQAGTDGTTPAVQPAAGGENATDAAAGGAIGAAGTTPEPPSQRPRPPAANRGGGARESGEPGLLRISAVPWANVQIIGANGKQDEETPVSMPLRPGKYTVKLTNPELKLSRTQVVRIRSNETTTLKIRWNE